MLTYILGAGASWGSRDKYNQRIEGIAPVEMIADELESLKGFLDKIHAANSHDGYFKNRFNSVKDELIRDLSWLQENTRNQLSIDTFAKKLWLRNENKNLTRLLAAYYVFLFYQESTCKVDKRYDGLFASLLNKNAVINLHNNIKFITWNYDSQFRRSVSSFVKTRGTVRDSHSIIREIDPLNIHILDDDTINYVRLNGTPNYFQETNKTNGEFNIIMSQYIENLDYDINKNEEDLYKLFVLINSLYFSIINKNNQYVYQEYISPMLMYSWDNSEYLSICRNFAKEFLLKSTDIVIIGYSFPFFNRETDYLLFKDLDINTRIYIQNPYPEQAITSLNSIKEFKQVVPITNVSQFYIPRAFGLT